MAFPVQTQDVFSVWIWIGKDVTSQNAD
jgi:hypothetical protein